ncbi:MAG: FAD-binding oxidoreductase [Promethearchaeota archaeon]
MSKEEKFVITVKSNTKDLYAFTKMISERKKRIEKASNEPITLDPINDLARSLHPERQFLVIKGIQEETISTKTFRLIPDPDSVTKELAYFRAGQYLSLKVEVNGVKITRPYSISSSPKDALEGFYEITIRREEEGFLTNYIWQNWKIGTKIESSGPEGYFYYEPLRDLKNIVGIAGGSGITPFRSWIKNIIDEESEIDLILLYGSSDEEDIIFYKEFKELEQIVPNQIKIVYILSCETISLEGCEQGFITSDIIEKYCDVHNSSFFICGPQIMYNFIEKELEKFNLPKKRIRREAFGEIKDVIKYPNFPQEVAGSTFKVKVQIGNSIKEIPAISTESILVALERANIAPPSKCRSGECGFCRSLLLSGEIFVSPISDWRREGDKQYKFFHPCASYPISDLEISVPRNVY